MPWERSRNFSKKRCASWRADQAGGLQALGGAVVPRTTRRQGRARRRLAGGAWPARRSKTNWAAQRPVSYFDLAIVVNGGVVMAAA